jgi:hypothetical protein
LALTFGLFGGQLNTDIELVRTRGVVVALIATLVAYKMGWDQEDVKENLVRAATTIKGKMPRRTVVMTIDQKDVVVLDEDAAPSKPAADKDVRRGGLPPVGARDGLENPLDPGE